MVELDINRESVGSAKQNTPGGCRLGAES